MKTFLCDKCFPGGEELTLGCLAKDRPCDKCGNVVNCLKEKYHFVRNKDILNNARLWLFKSNVKGGEGFVLIQNQWKRNAKKEFVRLFGNTKTGTWTLGEVEEDKEKLLAKYDLNTLYVI